MNAPTLLNETLPNAEFCGQGDDWFSVARLTRRTMRVDNPIWAYLFGAFLIVYGLGHAAGITSMGNRLFGVSGSLGATDMVAPADGRLNPTVDCPACAVLDVNQRGSKDPRVPGEYHGTFVLPRLDTSRTLPGADLIRILDAYRSWHADEGESTPGPSVVQRRLDDSDKNTDLNKTPVGDEGPLLSPYGPSWWTPHYDLQSQPTAEQARRAADLQRMQPKVDVIDTSVPWSVTPITPNVAVHLQQIRGVEVPLRATREIVLPEVSIEDALGTVRR